MEDTYKKTVTEDLKPDQIISVKELKNMNRIIAEKVISEQGFYTCTIDDKKTLIFK